MTRLLGIVLGISALAGPAAAVAQSDVGGPGLRDAIAKRLAELAYEARPAAGGGLSADNPAQGFGATFSASGVRLAAGSGGWELGVSLIGVGRQVDAGAPGALSPPTASGRQVDYPRGSVIEWYRNDPSGLEQGFTLSRTPPGEAGAPLRIRVAFHGLAPLLGEHGLDLVGAGGKAVARYRGLRAWDATGRELASRMEGSALGVDLVVDDRDAAYPVTVDPVINTYEATLLHPAGSGSALFGIRVAVDGDTAVVAAPQGFGNGSVQVFVRENGVWSHQAQLLHPRRPAATSSGAPWPSTATPLSSGPPATGRPRSTSGTAPAGPTRPRSSTPRR
jgi:FG-GAP repeat